jgi:biotin transport system substrate-specific component
MINHSISTVRLIGMIAAVVCLSLASQIAIPMKPVPITLQTFAVVLTGFLLGPAGGFVATLGWLMLGAIGLPVFAEGAGGLEHLGGPTAGYLCSFPFAAAVAGWGNAQRPNSTLRLFLVALLAHLLILCAGTFWLGTKIGAEAALLKGALPFLPGAALKSAAAALVVGWARAFRGFRRVRDRAAAPDRSQGGASSL